MGKAKVPNSKDPKEVRIQKRVPYLIAYAHRFPVERLGGKLHKDPEQLTYLHGLIEDLKAEGRMRNPVIVWNHHPLRGTKQPEWLLRAGSNRVWCAEQLGWTHVPALVTYWPEDRNRLPKRIVPTDPWHLEMWLKDPGVMWANDYGIGLIGVHKPEDMYKDAPRSELLNELKHDTYPEDRPPDPLKD